MKISLHIGRREIGFSIGKTFNLSEAQAQFLTGNDTDNSGGAKLSQPYAQSAWVYVAVSVLAENIAQIPLRFSRVPTSAKKELLRARGLGQRGRTRNILGDNIVEEGPAVELFEQPHPTMNRALFWEMLVTWQCLRGEVFLVPLDAADQPVDLTARRPRVARLLPLEPGLFWHQVQGYHLNGWRFTGSPLLTPIASQMLLPGEVVHLRTANPYLYWRGMSPLLLAMLPAAADYAAEQFMKGLLMNNADTGVIVTTDQQPSQEQREQLLAALRERKRKAGTPDRPLFLWGGSKIEKPTISNVDMEYLQNRKFNREEIFSIFKVPPSMAGIEDQGGGRSGLSNSGGSQQQDRRVFIENTVTTRCRHYESAILPIVQSFDPALVPWFDIDSLSIMQEARRDRLDSATKAFAMGATFNDINSIYDLGFPKYGWGDKGWLPFNLQEIGAGEAAPLPGPDANDPDAQENSFLRAQKFLAALAAPAPPAAMPAAPRAHVCAANPEFEASIAGSVKQKQGKLRKFFFEQRARVLQKFHAHFKAQKKSLDDIFDKAAEDLELLRKLKPLLLADLEFGGAQVFGEISQGVDFNLAPSAAIAFLDQREKVIKDINATTWNAVKNSIQNGLAKGSTMDEIADGIRAVYQMAGDARAQIIALTETTVATNSGRFQAMQDAGVERKGWRTSHLENTRETHWANEELSNAQNGIPIDDLWPNGLSYPGDPEGDAGEVINCRCFGFALKADPNAAGWTRPSKLLRFEDWAAQKIGGAR